jgi:putative peptidoglycan lipid II flippase
VQLPVVLRHEKRLRLGLDTVFAPVRDVFRNFVPVVVSRGVVQLSAYLDNMIATWLGTAAVSALAYAQTIYTLPVSLFGMSVAASELPQLSATVGTPEEVREVLRKRIERGLRQISFFVVPSAVAFILIGKVLVAALFEGGQFHARDTQYVWYILIGSTIGLVAATLGRLCSSGFYALRDTRTPLRFAVIRVVITGALGYLFAIPLRPFLLSALRAAHVPLPEVLGGLKSFGAIALTATAGIAGWIEFLLLRSALQKRIGAFASIAGYQTQLWVAALLSGIVAIACDQTFARALSANLPFHRIAEAAIVAGIFGAVYFATTIMMRIPEARSALARFRR